MRKRIVGLALGVLAGVLMPIVLGGQLANAQGLPLGDVQCTPPNRPTHSAFMGTPTGGYDVYARLGKPGQVSTAEVYYQETLGASCVLLGRAEITGDTWQSIGVLQPKQGVSGGIVTLSSSEFAGFFAANRPMVMLVPQDSPPCRPEVECEVTIDGQLASIRPSTKVGGLGETLRLVTVVDPGQDRLEGADYYIDNKPAYTKPTVEPFDMHYVGPGEHTLLTVARYASGQRAIITRFVDRGYTDGIVGYLLFSFIYGQQTILQLVVGLVVVLTFWWLALLAVHALYKRHLWKVLHFVKAPVRAARSGKPIEWNHKLDPLHIERPDHFVIALMKRLLPLAVIVACVVVVVSVVNRYVLQIYQVDGASMNRTLSDGSPLAVNTAVVTLSKLSGKPYLPARGDVVVFARAQDPTQALEDEEKGENIVKRVIGLPGERVVVNAQGVTIYNQDYPEGFSPDSAGSWNQSMVQGAGFLPDNVDMTIEPGMVFVCGDNRPHSTDSRTFGPINASSIIGKAEVELSPFKKL